MASIPRRIGVNLASIWLPNSRDFCHDRATIAPRSNRDRATIVVLILHRSPADRLETIPQGKNCDRGSIAARSDRNRGFFHVLSAPSDGASGERMATIARSRGLGFRGASAVRWRSNRADETRRHLSKKIN